MSLDEPSCRCPSGGFPLAGPNGVPVCDDCLCVILPATKTHDADIGGFRPATEAENAARRARHADFRQAEMAAADIAREESLAVPPTVLTGAAQAAYLELEHAAKAALAAQVAAREADARLSDAIQRVCRGLAPAPEPQR